MGVKMREFILFALILLIFAGCYTPVKPVRTSVHVKLYNPSTVVTVEGKIVEVKYRVIDGVKFVILMVETPSGIIPVHVGPYWWVERNRWMFNRGSTIVVTGSRVLYEGVNVIFASKIVSGPVTFVIRDPDGKPLWVVEKKKNVKKQGRGRKKGW